MTSSWFFLSTQSAVCFKWEDYLIPVAFKLWGIYFVHFALWLIMEYFGAKQFLWDREFYCHKSYILPFHMMFVEQITVEPNNTIFLGQTFYIQITCKSHTKYLLHKQVSVCFNLEDHIKHVTFKLWGMFILCIMQSGWLWNNILGQKSFYV